MIAAPALITFLFMSPAFHGDEVVMLDVGQGDAFILRSANQAMMIDTGNQDAAVLAGLARHDIRALDALVITHADDDHCGSLAAILDVVEVRRVCVARDLMTCDAPSCVQLRAVLRGCEVVEISRGDTITLGDFSAVEVSPDIYEDDGGNADSIVLDVRVDCNHDNAVDWTGLFCGDAEVEVLDHLVSEGRIGKVDLLKVGHHGSKVAVDDDVLSVLGPQVSLVSVGAGNRYGHPAQVTIEALERCGSRVLRTDTSGDVVCSLTAEQMSVRTIR
jgi:competence protein ComEC